MMGCCTHHFRDLTPFDAAFSVGKLTLIYTYQPDVPCCLTLAGRQHCKLELDVFVGTHCQLSGRQVNGLHPEAIQ